MGNHDWSLDEEIDATERVPFEDLEPLAPEHAADGTRTKVGAAPPLPDEAIASRAWLAKLEALAKEPPPPPVTIAPTRPRATLPPPTLSRLARPTPAPPLPVVPPSTPAQGSVAQPLPTLFTTGASPSAIFEPTPLPPPFAPETLPDDDVLDHRVLSKEWLLSTEHLALQPRRRLPLQLLAGAAIALLAGTLGYLAARGPATPATTQAAVAPAGSATATATPAAAPVPATPPPATSMPVAAAAAATATPPATSTTSPTGAVTATAAVAVTGIARTAAAPAKPAQPHVEHHATTRVAAAPRPTGLVMVATKPPCSIYVDGRATRLVTPQRALRLSPGQHVLAFVDDHHALRGRVLVNVEAHRSIKIVRDYIH